MPLVKAETAIYHLTPAGWAPGGEPPNRVESWRRTVSHDERISWHCEWVDLRRTAAERDALREQFHAFMA